MKGFKSRPGKTKVRILFALIFFPGFFGLTLLCAAEANAAPGNWYYSGGTAPNVEPTYGSTGSYGPDYRLSSPVTIPKGGRILKVGVKIQADTGTSDIKVGLFKDPSYASTVYQSGSSCALPISAPVGTGWVDCTLTTPWYIQDTTTLYVMVSNQLSGAITYYESSSGTKFYTNYPNIYDDFGGVYGNVGSANGAIAVRVQADNECAGDTTHNSTNVWTAYDSSLACVNDAINQAAREDTVIVPAGSSTWDSYLVVTRGIRLQGNGIDSTLITGTSDRIIYWFPDTTAVNNNEKFELTGLTFDFNDNVISDVGMLTVNTGATPLTKVKIWNNKFKNTSKVALYLMGTIYGVAYSNQFDKVNDPCKAEGRNEGAWHYLSRAYGSADNFYFEDNNISFSSTGLGSSSGGTTSGQGGRLVTRYNTFSLASATDGDFLDVHGLQTSLPPGTDTTCQSYASMVAENYGNIITDAPPISPRWMYHRGSWLLMFNNTMTYTGPAHGIGIGQYGCDSCAAWGYGTGQDVNNTYFWNNTANGSDAKAVVTLDYCTGDPRTENTHFWNYNASCTASNCSAGIGCGSSVPTGTCNTGVGYWVTSASPCSAPPSTMADMKRYTQAGTFYKCTAPNTWTAYYTPYTYPHPLRGEAPDTIAPAAPTGLAVR